MTLIRLYHREADYKGVWWGIRPENTGPYFDTVEWDQSARIGAVITSSAVLDADQDAATVRVTPRNRGHRIESGRIETKSEPRIPCAAPGAVHSFPMRLAIHEPLCSTHGFLASARIRRLRRIHLMGWSACMGSRPFPDEILWKIVCPQGRNTFHGGAGGPKSVTTFANSLDLAHIERKVVTEFGPNLGRS